MFSVDLAVTPAVFTCPVALIGDEAPFGRAMTLVDLDLGDGKPDHLLVGAPPTHAYLYSLPLTAGQTPETITDRNRCRTASSATAVAAFDIDGKVGDEMFIGNPDGSVGGATTAGRVSVFTGSPPVLVPTTVAPNPLAEHDPGAGHGYGSGIAGMLFCPGERRRGRRGRGDQRWRRRRVQTAADHRFAVDGLRLLHAEQVTARDLDGFGRVSARRARSAFSGTSPQNNASNTPAATSVAREIQRMTAPR